MRRASSVVGQKVSVALAACFFLGGLGFLYLNLFILPHVPIFQDEDPQIYLTNATRMLEGQVMYRDFFQITPPGTELVYLALFKLFGPRAWIPNVVLLFLGFILAWLTLEISKKVVKGWAAFLPGLLFLPFAFRIGFSGSTHNWFSTAAVLAATTVILDRRTPVRLVGAGALCGLASFFTQTRGVVAILGFAAFLLWERARKSERWRALLESEVCLFGAFLLTVVAANAYFVHRAGLKRFLDCTVLFVIRYFPSDSTYSSLVAYIADLPEVLFSGSITTYRLPALGIWLFIHALVPFVYLAFFVRHRREAHARPQEPWDRLMLLNVTGLFQFIGIAPAPSWFRLCSVSVPALVIFTWLVRSPGKLRQTLVRSLWVVALILAIAEPLKRQINWWIGLDLPPGRTAFLNRGVYDKVLWLHSRTRPSEFFFRAIYPDYYFPLGLRNPAGVPYVTPTDYTRPEQVENVVEALEKYRVRFVFWSVWLDIPGASHPEGDHLGPLRRYLRQHYHVVTTFSDADFEQVWQRNQ